MVCWLDSFSGHTDGDFRKFCRQQGVILMTFRSHSTVWACALDKQAFGHYDTAYNKEIQTVKRSKRRECGKGNKVPLHLAAVAICKACDAGFDPHVIKDGHLKTIWSLKKDGEGAQEMSTLTTKFSNSEQWESEPLPALFLDVEDVLERHCSVIDDAVKGLADLEPDANPTEKTVARQVDAMKDQGKVADRVWHELKERVGLQWGTNCELDADGKYKCESCRSAREKFEAKGEMFEWAGDCMTMEDQEKRHDERVAAKDQAESEKNENAAQKDAKKKEKEAEEREKQARLDAVVKSLDKILAMGERGAAFQSKRDQLTNFDYERFNVRSHPTIQKAKARLVALNEQYKSKQGEYGTMTKEDKLEQHEDAVDDFMKQWMELIQSKAAQDTGIAGEKQNALQRFQEGKVRKQAKALIESMSSKF